MGQAKGIAADVTGKLLGWLDTLSTKRPGAPVLLYAHYMEVHWLYTAPPQAVERVLARYPDPEQARKRLGKFLFSPPPPGSAPDAAARAALVDLYDASVVHLDDELRTLFAGLEARRFLDNAVVVITADHGEALTEHGDFGHGRSLYNELTHVPLGVFVSWARGRSDVQDAVSLVDIAPTMRELARIEPAVASAGRSLRPLLPEPSRFREAIRRVRRLIGSQPRAAVSELLASEGARDRRVHEAAIVEGSKKLTVKIDGSLESYDLRADPGETNPQGLDPSDVERLRSKLLAARTVGQRAPDTGLGPIDEQTRERLRALGYEE